jgi:hypothetical protein
MLEEEEVEYAIDIKEQSNRYVPHTLPPTSYNR